MNKEEVSVIDQIGESVERVIQSRQPRFSTAEDMFISTIRWFNSMVDDEPPYNAKSKTRDAWLSNVWRDEPHLAGVLNSASLIHTNRGWSMTGGRNQVYRAAASAHNWGGFPALKGWRPGMMLACMSFYTTDLNTILEVWRDGKNGPFRGFRHTDTTRCQLTGNARKPLGYWPRVGRKQEWGEDDFIRLASLPSIHEDYHGLGFCAVSRCIELAKIMIALYQHELEQLGARAPKGLLLLQGISQKQWNFAMEKRKEILTGLEREYFGGVAVLASSGVDEVDAKLVALSSLPETFDLKTFTDLLMYGYALALGFDPSEFWPVQFGSLGRGLEAQVQHQKATGKGGLSFPLALQEKFQEELPSTVQFEFDQRDDAGDLSRAQVSLAWVEVADKLYQGGTGIVSQDQAMSILAQAGVVPPEWSVVMEQTVVTDTERYVPRVLRAAERFPQEPIVRLEWPTGKETIIWHRGEDAFKQRIWQVTSSDIARALA